MDDLIGTPAISGGEVGLVLAVVWQALKNLKIDLSQMREQIHEVKTDVDRKLNNGIKDEMTQVRESVARIEGQMAVMPRRKDDVPRG